MTVAKPAQRPNVPHFSSGPCAKRPGWKVENLQGALVGRSHRSKPGKARLKAAIDQTRDVLQSHRHVRVSPYAGGFPNYVHAASAYALAPSASTVTGSCPEMEGYPDCP